jgi:hypothetical protein
MENFDRKKHWENIYQTKELKDVSWFEPTPAISLDFVKQFNIPITAKIIDVGGGDSLLVDKVLIQDFIFGFLLKHSHKQISVGCCR